MIGLKLYVWTKIERPKQKEAKKQAEKKEFYDYIRTELKKRKEQSQAAVDAAMQWQEQKRQNDILQRQLEQMTSERQWKEKARMICRDLWYGTCPKNGVDREITNDGFEEILNDPETIFLKNYDPDSFSGTICVKSKGKTYQFIVNRDDMFKYR